MTPAVTDFVQIINTGGHWVCLSTIGCANGYVKVYDSMGTSPSPTAIINSCQMLFHMVKRLQSQTRKFNDNKEPVTVVCLPLLLLLHSALEMTHKKLHMLNPF